MAWDVADLQYTEKFGGLGTASAIAFMMKADGTRMWWTEDNDQEFFYQRSMSTAWDVTTVGTLVNHSYLSGFTGGFPQTNLLWNADGSRLGSASPSSNEVAWWTVPTAFDVTSIAGNVENTNWLRTKFTTFPHPPYADMTGFSCMQWNSDGTVIFVEHAGDGLGGGPGIASWGVDVPYSLAKYTDADAGPNTAITYIWDFPDTGGRHFAWGKKDASAAMGTRLFVLDGANKIYQYDVITPYALSELPTLAASYDDVLDLTTISDVSDARGFEIKPDGTKMFVMDRGTSRVKEFTMIGFPVGGGVYISGTGLVEDCDTGTVNQPEHLDAGDVVCQVDGLPDDCTSDGAIVTLEASGGSINVGLRYVADVELLDVEARAGETVFSRPTNVAAVVVNVEKSVPFLIGPNRFRMSSISDYEFVADEGSPPAWDGSMFTGKARVVLLPDWNSNGRVFMRQHRPGPLTVLSVTPENSFGETADD